MKPVAMATFSLMTLASALFADAPEIVSATATERGAGWSFSVTIRHGDTGWDHYADGWRILDASGHELGQRTLFHPHENEQPFTRSLDGVRIPPDTRHVFIQAKDNKEGWADPLFKVALPQ